MRKGCGVTETKRGIAMIKNHNSHVVEIIEFTDGWTPEMQQAAFDKIFSRFSCRVVYAKQEDNGAAKGLQR